MYNGERLLNKTLESLLAQDYSDIVIRIADNASTDRTEDICRDFVRQFPRKILYRRHNINLGATKNFAFLKDTCETEFFMWAGAHDQWSNNFVSSCAKVLQQDNKLALAYPDVVMCDEQGRVTQTDPNPDTWNALGTISERYSTYVWKRKRCIQIYGLMRTSLIQGIAIPRILGGDNVFLAAVSLAGGIKYVPNAVIYFSDPKSDEKTEEMWERQRDALQVSQRTPPLWCIYFYYVRLIVVNRKLSVREKLMMIDDTIWSFQMRNHEALKKESKLMYAFQYQINRLLNQFRRRPIPW